jgi:hypothetical protein
MKRVTWFCATVSLDGDPLLDPADGHEAVLIQLAVRRRGCGRDTAVFRGEEGGLGVQALIGDTQETCDDATTEEAEHGLAYMRCAGDARAMEHTGCSQASGRALLHRSLADPGRATFSCRDPGRFHEGIPIYRQPVSRSAAPTEVR